MVGCLDMKKLFGDIFLNDEGRPKIANALVAAIVTVAIIVLYAVFVPFTFVFKVDGETVYTQHSVYVLTDYSEKTDNSELSKNVYGEGAEHFFYTEDGEKIPFSKPYKGIRGKLFMKAVMNFITLNWDEENYIVEFNS